MTGSGTDLAPRSLVAPAAASLILPSINSREGNHNLQFEEIAKTNLQENRTADTQFRQKP